MHIDNKEMGKQWDKKVVQQLALTSVDADGDMHMACWDLDKSCHVEDWGRENVRGTGPSLRLTITHQRWSIWVRL